MKKIIGLLFLLFSFSVYSNYSNDNLSKNGTISGRIVDADSKEPIPYATIVLKGEASESILGGDHRRAR